jgi:Flp pilus assembly CpaE family ATPase
MTVTYMFRARNPESRGRRDGNAPTGASSDGPSHALMLPGPFPAPDAQVSDTRPPLILSDRVDSPDDPAQAGLADAVPAKAGPDPRVIAAALPVPAGLPARYVATEGRIILVAKARGGIGATTLAVNLALEMQMQAKKRIGTVGGRVALVDLDVQLGNAGSFLDLADRGGMLALAQLGSEPDAQAVRHAMVRHPTGLDVMTAPATAIPFEAFDAGRIASMLDALAAAHDVVVVDLPPALIDWLEPVLARAERLLMVTDLAVPSIVRARRIITLLTDDRPQMPVEIVVAHERKPFRPGQTHRDAEAALGHPLRHWLPDESRLARQALDRGEPLVLLAPRCNWSRAVKAMAADMQTPVRTGTRAAARGDH